MINILCFSDWLFKYGCIKETLGNNIVLYLRYKARLKNKIMKGVIENEKKKSKS